MDFFCKLFIVLIVAGIICFITMCFSYDSWTLGRQSLFFYRARRLMFYCWGAAALVFLFGV